MSPWGETHFPRFPLRSLDRIVRETMEQLGTERDDEPEALQSTVSNGPLQFDTAPGLSFTKPLAASINGKALHAPRWSTILLTLIGQVKAKGVEGERLVRELAIPAKVQEYEDEGYKYHSDLGVPVQGQSASDCWKEVERLATKWRISVSVEFLWRPNTKAQYPGKIGVLRSANA